APRGAEIEAGARRLLEHRKDLEPREPIRRYSSLLRLWRFPAYGVQTTWTILTPGKKAPPGSAPMVREIVWDREADEKRVFGSGGESGEAASLTLGVPAAVLSPPELVRSLLLVAG